MRRRGEADATQGGDGCDDAVRWMRRRGETHATARCVECDGASGVLVARGGGWEGEDGMRRWGRTCGARGVDADAGAGAADGSTCIGTGRSCEHANMRAPWRIIRRRGEWMRAQPADARGGETDVTARWRGSRCACARGEGMSGRLCRRLPSMPKLIPERRMAKGGICSRVATALGTDVGATADVGAVWGEAGKGRDLSTKPLKSVYKRAVPPGPTLSPAGRLQRHSQRRRCRRRPQRQSPVGQTEGRRT